jgi:hypothetical protein
LRAASYVDDADGEALSDGLAAPPDAEGDAASDADGDAEPDGTVGADGAEVPGALVAPGAGLQAAASETKVTSTAIAARPVPVKGRLLFIRHPPGGKVGRPGPAVVFAGPGLEGQIRRH